MKIAPQFLLIVASILATSTIACTQSADENPSGQTPADAGSDAAATNENVQEPATDVGEESSANKTVCESIASDDLKSITGSEYATTNSTANFSNIKHCEYSSGDRKFVVNVLIAFDKTANERMEQNKRFPGVKPVADFEDEANWEPVRGAFTALSGHRCVEIQVSKGHGDDSTRLKMAREIAALVLKRY